MKNNSARFRLKQDETWIGAFIDGEYLYSAIGRLNEYDSILLRLYSKPDFDYKELSREISGRFSSFMM